MTGVAATSLVALALVALGAVALGAVALASGAVALVVLVTVALGVSIGVVVVVGFAALTISDYTLYTHLVLSGLIHLIINYQYSQMITGLRNHIISS
jgi:hypothetical protein